MSGCPFCLCSFSSPRAGPTDCLLLILRQGEIPPRPHTRGPSRVLCSVAFSVSDADDDLSLSQTQAKPIFRSLISAVAFLHRNDITHNDIKPANILLSSAGVPVIVDFGFATRWDPFEDEDPFISTNFFGTQEYLSPTRARGYSHDERASDVWSLGVGILPFAGLLHGLELSLTGPLDVVASFRSPSLRS